MCGSSDWHTASVSNTDFIPLIKKACTLWSCGILRNITYGSHFAPVPCSDRSVLCHLFKHMDIRISTNATLLRDDGCVRAHCEAFSRHSLDTSAFAMLDPCHLYLSGLLLPLLLCEMREPFETQTRFAFASVVVVSDKCEEPLSKKSHQKERLLLKP